MLEIPAFDSKDVDPKLIYMTTIPTKTRFFHFAPDLKQIHMADIALALSNTCRFNGHVPYHYSVAYHCILCWRVLMRGKPTKKMQRTMLLHDAAETYWPDMHSMAKRRMPVFMEQMGITEELIAQKFDCHYPEPTIIKHIDGVLLSTELIKLKQEQASVEHPDMSITFRQRSPESVRKEFLRIYRTLA